jgi:anti-sigma-K factor RskA
MVDKTQNEPEREILAAEYAVGVLDLAERVRVRRLIAEDSAFAELVARWEERLTPIGENIPPVEPPASVRSTVAARLFGESGKSGWWHSLNIWRPLALAAIALLVVSGLFNINELTQPPPQPGATLVVSLESADSPVRFVALYEEDGSSVRASAIAGAAAADRDFELWLVPQEGAPLSLGLLPDSGSVALDLPPDIAARFAEGATLAISDEPEGGSPTGAPTGPVVAAGQAKRI